MYDCVMNEDDKSMEKDQGVGSCFGDLNKGGVPVAYGILPRREGDDLWLSRAVAVNCMLAKQCKDNGWEFAYNWDCFSG